MSLNEARRLVRLARRLGVPSAALAIRDDRDACRRRHPKAHPMCGHSVVVYSPDGGAPGLLWCRADVESAVGVA